MLGQNKGNFSPAPFFILKAGSPNIVRIVFRGQGQAVSFLSCAGFLSRQSSGANPLFSGRTGYYRYSNRHGLTVGKAEIAQMLDGVAYRVTEVQNLAYSAFGFIPRRLCPP